jgi:hypothetical protein
VISDQELPDVVLPAETDSVQLSPEVEYRLPGDLGWRDQEKADPAALALWASPYVVSVGGTLDLFVQKKDDDPDPPGQAPEGGS